MKVSELQINSRVFPLQQPKPVKPGVDGVQKVQGQGSSFGKVLEATLEQNQELRFSAHALRRLEERQVDISGGNLERLNEGVRQLNAKGSTNSVILMDETAFVVSVKNRTVVTAVDKTQSTNNVFTNIDSLAIV